MNDFPGTCAQKKKNDLVVTFVMYFKIYFYSE